MNNRVFKAARLIAISALIALALCVAPSTRLAPPAAAQTGTGTVKLCGTVTVWTAPTGTTAGALTIAGTAFVVPANTALVGVDNLTVGASMCLNGTLNAAGQLTAGTLSTNVSTALNLCGTVGAYTAATATAVGTLTLGTSNLTIVAGTTLTADNLLTVGTNVCLAGTVNGLGQVTAGTISVPLAAVPDQGGRPLGGFALRPE